MDQVMMQGSLTLDNAPVFGKLLREADGTDEL